MKRLLMVFALMLAVATMMMAVTASAVFIGEDQGGRAYWESQVGSFSGVDLPQAPYTTLAAYTEIALPYGGVFRTNEDLERRDVGAGWATWNPYIPGTELLAQLSPSGSNYVANFNFWPSGVDSPIQPATSFGFEVEPNSLVSSYVILLYTPEGELSQLVAGDSGAKFFGWIDEEVAAFTIIAYTLESDGLAIGRFVEGTGAAVPEAGSMLLLGSGLVALIGYRRMKRMK